MPTLRTKSFTLIELLVVVAVIAVLAALLLPSLSRARHLAQRIACLTAVRQLNLAVILYADDNEGYMPVPQGSNFRDHFVENLYTESGNFTSQGCPHGPARYNSANYGNEYYWDSRNPSTGVGINSILLGGNGYNNSTWGYKEAMSYRSTRLAKHGDLTPVTMDQYHVARWNGIIGSTAYGAREDAFKIHIRAMSGIENWNIPDPWAVRAVRHQGEGLNYSFVDGSGRFIKTRAAFTVANKNTLRYANEVLGLTYYDVQYPGPYIDENAGAGP